MQEVDLPSRPEQQQQQPPQQAGQAAAAPDASQPASGALLPQQDAGQQQQPQQQPQPSQPPTSQAGSGQAPGAPPKPASQKARAAAAAAGEQVLPLNNERFMVPEVCARVSMRVFACTALTGPTSVGQHTHKHAHRSMHTQACTHKRRGYAKWSVSAQVLPRPSHITLQISPRAFRYHPSDITLHISPFRYHHVPSDITLQISPRAFHAQVLFHPSDIGLMQAGVAEAVVQAVQAVHPSLHALLYTNVILTGELCAG